MMQWINNLKKQWPNTPLERWNIILGWAVFVIAWGIYSLTIEPTVSFWDAGEYIATSAKLEVAHPPGAPLLQMIGAFFAMFAFSPSQVALMVNYVSTVSSAFTIVFMFWTLTNLLGKLTVKEQGPNTAKTIAILGSALVGSLAFTFSDSFWFNAVETEVYSMASFIMALLLWLGLKWVDAMESPRANKWLLLICFVVGLTFGIQFMGFLAIPSIVLLFFFKKYETFTFKRFCIANIVAVGTLLLVFKFSLTYVLKLFGWSEVFFVNTFGLPFNSGSVLMGLFLAFLFYIGLRYTRKRNYHMANTLILATLFLFLGFSSWLALPIRANAHVAINENDPSDARALLAYYNREQYPSPDSPFYGTYYSNRYASSNTNKDDRPKYEKDKVLGKYKIVNQYKNVLQGAHEDHVGFLPRMWSSTNAANYMKYFGALDFHIKPEYRSDQQLKTAVRQYKEAYAQGKLDEEDYIRFLEESGDYIEVVPVTLAQNLNYMLQYQFNYMYWRYFMWNFVGRSNDIQGQYDGNGEWLSGITFLDEMRLGSQDNLPSDVKDNKARNTYFFLPFILGLLGIVFQLSRNPKQFWVLFVFFMFTGLAIQFYTNPPIFQPRERDYSLVGSFYIFAIWIGLGAYGLYTAFSQILPTKIWSIGSILLCLVAVPGLMGYQNWDDHDRSDRYTANAMAKAYLDSAQEGAGAILFTIGDNDTFPLWYMQEIEAYRTDVRIIVTGYFAADWYIDQMKRRSYNSPAIPSQITHDKYAYGTRDLIYHHGLTEERWDIKDWVNWVDSDKPQTKFKYIMERQGVDIRTQPPHILETVYYPTNKIRIPVNKKNVLDSGLVRPEDAHLILDYIDIDLPKTALYKNRMMMLDVLANNDWKRPIYFSGGSYEDEEYLWLKDYLQLDGLIYKLVPIKTKNESPFELGRLDSELMYAMVKKWDWGNAGSPDIYHDPQTRKQGGVSFRISLARLTETLIAEGKTEKAKEIIALAMQNIPLEYFGYYTFVEPFLDGYYKVGEQEKGNELFRKLKKKYQEELEYLLGMTTEEQYRNIESLYANVSAYQRIVDILIRNKETAVAETEAVIFNEYLEKFAPFLAEE
ncbi:glycosyltransferase family 117 protein [Spongiimicrobium salis]|uniref:glycosyltransferase family 117 protein n=1 Tax=Spongiimicrobium salis TaxID=1667022 RepID=UPI00374D4480